ncbi:MAG: rod-binding protein [Alphaproteobacteria bacterium]|nr:rod-binding protein [Alphaproteobacteria bacterium]
MMQAAQAGAASAANNAKNALSARDMARIDGAANEFEAMFLSEMMKPMFEGLSTEAPFGGGKGEEIFRGMMIQEYGKMLSGTGRIGIADAVRAEMIRMQEQANGQTKEKGGIN